MARSAIVLGGTAGVGHAVVEALLDRGYRVGVVARGEARLAEMQRRFSTRIATRSADVADSEAVDRVAAELVDEIGRPEVWVNSAMITSFSPFSKVGADEFERIVDVTFLGQVNGTRAALRHMDRGRIVCIGSGLSYRSVPYQAAYCAAKHAINGFVGAVRTELLHDGSAVDISLVQLPAVNTPQFDWAKNRMSRKPQPAPPIFAPEVAADAVMKAIDQGLREVLVGSSVMKLTFCQFVLPAYMDRALADAGVDAQKSDSPDNLPGDNMWSPVEYPARAEGSYSARASHRGVTMDADLARKLVFFGVPAAALALGVMLGRSTRPSGRADRRLPRRGGFPRLR